MANALGIIMIHIPSGAAPDCDFVNEFCLKRNSLKLIEASLETGSVLVTCYDVCNRSAAAVVAFLNLVCEMPLTDAFESVSSKRGCILTNYKFRRNLVSAAQLTN